MKTGYLSFFLICFLALSAWGGESAALRVHDGDTFALADAKYRIWGVDAPELDQPWGIVARETLRQLLANGEITTIRKGKSWNRMVVQCSAGEKDVALELLKMGLAWYLPKFAPKRQDYREAEAEAREAKRGLWSDKKPVAPETWRKQGKR